MILEKINKLISDILEVSNINEEDFRYLNGKNINIVLKKYFNSFIYKYQ